MTLLEIVPSTSLHVFELSKTMRGLDKLEAERLGLDPIEALKYSFKHSVYHQTALLNDEVVAMWGAAGEILGTVGRPYLVTTTNVEQIAPIIFIRIYKAEVAKMKQIFPKLEGYVDASYEQAKKALKLCGFTLEGPMTINNNQFFKYMI